jgi:hypothetical protein
VQRRDVRERAEPARARNTTLLPSRVQPTTSSLPLWNVSCFAAPPARDHEHVVVAVAIRRERDPLAVGREARIDVARGFV